MFRRPFSSSSALASRAIVFSQPGIPSAVVNCLSLPRLPAPPAGTVNIKFLLAPINPSDINVIEGKYPSRPDPVPTSGEGSPDKPVFVCGNEGLAEVTAVGNGIEDFKTGDWVVLTKQQGGTWISSRNVHAKDIVRLPSAEAFKLKLSQVHGATMTVNPATAYNMLHDFVSLKEGDWVVQSGANSAVGQAVVQISAVRGIKTINFIRNRENLSALKEELSDLGATHVLTYDNLLDKSLRDKVQDWTGGKDIRLALDCVGGRETALMARLLGQDAHLVSYGAMSKQPISLPASQLIFRNLKCHGFWQSRWYTDHSREEREALMRTLTTLMINGKLKEPKHEIIMIEAKWTDESATAVIKSTLASMAEGRYGKKVLLKIEEP